MKCWVIHTPNSKCLTKSHQCALFLSHCLPSQEETEHDDADKNEDKNEDEEQDEEVGLDVG